MKEFSDDQNPALTTSSKGTILDHAQEEAIAQTSWAFTLIET